MSAPHLGRRAALALPSLLAMTGAARADWPERPVRLIVPFTPGSVTDVVARIVADSLSQVAGKPVVVENRPGGSAVVGTMAAASAAPDGYTLVMLTPTSAALNPHLLRRLSYDPIRDFAPVGQICECPYLLVIDPSLPARNLREFLELARQRPNEFTYSYGNQSAQIAGAVLAKEAKVQMLGVPYRGGPEALTDVMAGRVHATFTDFSNGLANAREGKVRALGVTSREPYSLAPDIPPIAEVIPGFEMIIWFGLSAPVAMPPVIGEQIGKVLRTALEQPTLQRRLAEQGFRPKGGSPDDWTSLLRSELVRWGGFVRDAGIEPQ
ncbi:MAG: ABC transporter substrate-binding protein [Azospirillum brasilense]|nr:MAG: ABC transporter substrate-binding protein [Azospirillum brasilense]